MKLGAVVGLALQSLAPRLFALPQGGDAFDDVIGYRFLRAYTVAQGVEPRQIEGFSHHDDDRPTAT